MGATFARSRTFVAGEILTATNLNGIETNILNNFTPAGMDDYSPDITTMRVVTDPYPAGVESLATSLQGELERIRYVMAQITGKTYWYQDPDFALSALTNYLLKSGGTMTGALVQAVGSAVASAATIDLTAVAGNACHITGTTAITAVTLAAGKFCEVIFDGVLTLTHNATTNNLPGAANITTAAGDRALYWSDGTTVYCLHYQRADGMPPQDTRFAIGSFTRDMSLASGPQSITGIGFPPKMILLLVGDAVGGTVGKASVGFSNGTTNLSLVNYHNITADSWVIYTTLAINIFATSTSYNYGTITPNSDGFTVDWVKVGSQTGTITINYLALR